MVDAIISPLLEQLISFTAKEMKEPVRLVTGVGTEVKRLTGNLQAIQAVLNDAEKRQFKEETVRVWLDQLKDVSYDIEDVLDEWNTARQKLRIEGVGENALAPQKVCSFFPAPCFGFKQVFLRRDIALKIQEINEKLNDLAKQKDMFSFNVTVMNSTETPKREPSVSLIDESEIIGRVEEQDTLISKLVCGTSSEQEGLRIISLVGMGGIGKTTLAQLAYNNEEVKRTFDRRIWVCVSENFDQIRIAGAIIEAVEESRCNLVEFQSLINRIQNIIMGKKFLLILDDVWTEDYSKWEPFYRCLKNGLHGSKILITTRKAIVARVMRSTIIRVGKLAEEECWSLFERLAFFGRSNEERERLEQIGRNIVRKCKGLPLAAKTIGSLLLSKDTKEEWQYVLDIETWEQEELEESLFAPLLLSYNDLPSMVKRCFSYCAIFPKNYRMYKYELIRLWMAQGYLGGKKNKEMEIIGEEYFDILASRSFFQEFEKDDLGNVIRCKMHDIVHDFAQFVSKGECFTIEVPNGPEQSLIDSFHMKVCHSMLTFGEEVPIPVSIFRFQRLRSLLTECNRIHRLDYSSINEVLAELFRKLTCLRVLDLSAGIWQFCGFQLLGEIPTSVEKLVHLRYINLSGQNMEKLPEGLCGLYNLQILDVGCCRKLKELPQGIGKLINMMYLLNHCTESLWLMPEGISRLTNLRRLTKFVHHSQGCTIGSLKHLKLLRGCRMDRLGNVSDVDEAKRLELDKMKNLLDLSLSFDRDGEGEGANEEDEQLLEALQPPLNLECLEIWNYRGNSIFPNWLMSLTNIRILVLCNCGNCEHLPPLGKLPSLEKLSINVIEGLKKVGNEFLGIESNNGSSSSIISFPKLKSLQLVWMVEWEEWDYGIERMGEIMPRLSTLTIHDCPKLKALPDHLLRGTTLKSLEIQKSPILRERYRERTGADWPKISHIPHIKIFPR